MLWIVLSLLCSCTSREQIGSFAPAPSPTQRIEEKDNAQWCDQAANALYGRRLCLRNNNLLWGGNVVTEGETLFYSPNEAVYSYCSNTFACISLEEELSLWSLEENAFLSNMMMSGCIISARDALRPRRKNIPYLGSLKPTGFLE